MLNLVSAYVVRYTKVIATVVNINVEVVASDLTRIAGTGMYAEGVGQSIKNADQVYTYVLQHKHSVLMQNPRENTLCEGCLNLPGCKETLSLCTPIIYNGQAIGIIGIVCFTQAEKKRILAQIDLYQDFVEQMANAIAMAVSVEQKVNQTQHLLDTFLHITDIDNRGILILSTAGTITYLNDTARKELHLNNNTMLDTIAIRKTGDTFSNKEEIEATVDGRQTILLGHFTQLESQDSTFNTVLVFDTLPQYTNMIAKASVSHKPAGLRAIIGDSTGIIDLKQQVIRIAKTPSTVLITGESGTGKEMFARAIHAESDRSSKPFVAVNCGAIPDTLLESELFGYVRGAFTGASPTGHIGKFEMAHEGVLFLDEISALPLYLQVKLLRVLQDRTITRLGSNRVVSINVRIIAATNEDLYELMEQRMFRDDLYYRLNVIPLRILPLRERKDDIPALASFFLEKYCKLFSKKLVRPTIRALQALEAYTWPGNVREFENIMEYIVNLITDGGSITVGMLPAKIQTTIQTTMQEQQTAQAEMSLKDGKAISSQKTLPCQSIMPLKYLEQKALHEALTVFGDTAEGKKQAAKALGIGIATLYRKLKEV